MIDPRAPLLEPPRYTVAVRALCEFTARGGDLDLRYTPAPTALQGIAGHSRVAASGGATYEREVALQGRFGPLRVRGRADGFDATRGRLDEVKTHRGSLARQNPGQRALHWAQARIYGWLLCEQRRLDALDVALVYLDIDSGQETVFTESHRAGALHAYFDAQCQRYLHWAEHEAAHRVARDATLAALAFAHPTFRAGQRELAAQVWRAAQSGRCLLAQAPTGIGKTAATLFGQLKAAVGQRLDKMLYLTAKTSGRQMALDALARLTGARQSQAPRSARERPVVALRTLELVARDNACEYPGRACHGAACPLAAGFFDRLPAARSAALAPDAPMLLTQARVREVALAHDICPYYLSQELARWADVVVGDYNYWFDSSALLYALAQSANWRAALLVDEAHNLVERARGMYSAQLKPDTLRQATRSATATRAPRVRKALAAVRDAWHALQRAQTPDYATLATLPAPLAAALARCAHALSEHLAEHPVEADAPLLQWHFALLQFNALLERFDPRHSLIDSQRAGRDCTISLRCIVPAPHLAARWAAAHTTTLFSATLKPARYHADLLGLPADHVAVEVAAPFHADQLGVHVAQHISTRWTHRAQSVEPIVALMARQFAAQPGNYLAFFSSHDYLAQVHAAFAAQHPGIAHWRQERGMGEAAQRAFLARFCDGGQGIGFAVLGGVFAEGVDLPGQRLIGAFVCTLGLPQVNAVNEQVRARLQALFGRGHDYAYLYPGLHKVVQAAGRVIRAPDDRGVVHLIDDRFGRTEVRALLPQWWRVPLS